MLEINNCDQKYIYQSILINENLFRSAITLQSHYLTFVTENREFEVKDTRGIEETIREETKRTNAVKGRCVAS